MHSSDKNDRSRFTLEYRVDVLWRGDEPDSQSTGYSREHTVRFPGKTELAGSSSLMNKNRTETVSPEDLFIASISSCQMLSFLNIAHKNDLQIRSYRDEAKGYMTAMPDGRFHIEQVILSPRIEFYGNFSQEMRMLAVRLVHEANGECFITNSVMTSVEIHPFIMFHEI